MIEFGILRHEDRAAGRPCEVFARGKRAGDDGAALGLEVEGFDEPFVGRDFVDETESLTARDEMERAADVDVNGIEKRVVGGRELEHVGLAFAPENEEGERARV